MMKQRLIRHLLTAWLALAASPALAGDGVAVGVDPEAVARLNTTSRVLIAGADVSVGETIITGASGLVQIVFADQTRLVVGPHSTLLIETYLMANANTAQRLTVNALSGSFRFISGNSPKPAYSIKTPTAAIAVRGTSFDIIAEPGRTRAMLYDGALEICNRAGACAQLTQRCEVALADSGQSARLGREDPQRTPQSLLFRYARFQASLLAPFRVSGAALCAEDPAPDTNSDSPSSDESDPPPAPGQTEQTGQQGVTGPAGPGTTFQ
jgi:hypothetical protein